MGSLLHHRLEFAYNGIDSRFFSYSSLETCTIAGLCCKRYWVDRLFLPRSPTVGLESFPACASGSLFILKISEAITIFVEPLRCTPLEAYRFRLLITMSGVNLPPATHRQRAPPQGELEAASTLKLGADQNTHTLSLSEARLVIDKVLENKRRGGKKYEEPENLIKTLEYLSLFARFKDEENIKAVERLLNSHTELEMFERSQLGSLCCDNADEAKSLIPSLQNKISDGELQELLDELTKLRNFTE